MKNPQTHPGNTSESQFRIGGGGFRLIIRTSIQTQFHPAGPSHVFPLLHFFIFHIYIYSTVYTGLDGNELEAHGTNLLSCEKNLTDKLHNCLQLHQQAEISFPYDYCPELDLLHL
jgi:hypothetical protein